VSERYADGVVSQRELAKARRKAQDAWTARNNAQPQAYELSRDAGEEGGILITAIDAAKSSAEKDSSVAAWSANICAAHTIGHQAATLCAPATYDDPDTYVREELAGRQSQYVRQCWFLHDIFGNPFHPIAVDPTRMTPAVVKLANAIYDERRVSDLRILADALEEAGCTNAEILNHCRSEGPHVRGCWVVDLILGKQ
jgi:hypothetical protein